MYGGPHMQAAMRQQYAYENINPAETDSLIIRAKGEGTVFYQNGRVRMNAVAMFVSIFLPWGVACLVCGICSFKLMFKNPRLACVLLSIMFILWMYLCMRAYLARRGNLTESEFYNPDPTWMTFICLAVGIALFSGVGKGMAIYNQYTAPYMSLQSMKIAGMGEGSGGGINVGLGGEAIMDAGIVKFAPSTAVDFTRASHFMYKTLYCVAPLVSNKKAPESQNYDVWVVGKDCCATGSADFRCGAWANPKALFGTRVMSDKDLQYYSLAVQQAESVFHISSKHPIFFVQSTDPFGTGYSEQFGGVGGSGSAHDSTTGAGKSMSDGVNSGGLAGMNREAQEQFLKYSAFMLLFFVFLVTCAAAKFSFMGRSRHPVPGFDRHDPAFRESTGMDGIEQRLGGSA